MDLALARGANERLRGAFPRWRQVNVFLEAAPTDPKGAALLSRPPLVPFASLGPGPINGLYQRHDLFDGDLFTVSGNKVYRSAILIGTIGGSGPVSWASSRSELVLTRGGTAYSYKDGVDFAAISFPDSAPVTAVAFIGGLFVYVRGDEGFADRYYWSALNDGRTIDGLDYATAESEPDRLYDIKAIGDNLYALGAGSGEVWMLTGTQNLPFSRLSQRTLGRGVQGPGCAEVMDNTLQFLGSDGVVWRMEEVAKKISDNALEEKIRASLSARIFQWLYEGHLVLCLRLDQGTWGFDISTGQWSELQTYGRDNYAAWCSTQADTDPLFGDDTTGDIWQFGAEGDQDCGLDAFPRIFSAGAPMQNAPQGVANVLVDGNAGSATAETGPASDPVLEMRFSRDGGKTWSNWRAAKWGRQGEYRRLARYGGCGYFEHPGVLMEFRMTSTAPLRVSAVRVNESLAGRGRA